ncbi:hypothetical protein GCM10027299_51150 [Larkinella ripae]
MVLYSLFFGACHERQELPALIKIPLEVQEGYGPFRPGFGILSAETDDYPKGPPSRTSSLPLRGIPTAWTNRVTTRIDLDSRQFIYQNFCAGNVDSAWYSGFLDYWNWEPDRTQLSEKPIKCYIYVVRGYDPLAGKWAVLVDTNNNLDFGDETAVYPEPQDPTGQNFAYQKPLIIAHEMYRKGRVIKTKTPMVIKTLRGDFVYNFPQYASAVLTQGSKKHELLISSGGFNQLDYESIRIVEKPSWFWQKTVPEDKLVDIGEYITLDGISYKNLGVDVFNNELQLERGSPNPDDYVLQAGHPFRPFRAREFTTGKPITLADFKGKYLYIDFWATWCKGCVQDMPELKQTYRDLDKNRFAFLGVVGDDKPERVRQFLRKEAIDWPQIFSDSTDKITRSYAIKGLPVTVLLGPDGRVIAKDLRGKALTDKLRELAAR